MDNNIKIAVTGTGYVGLSIANQKESPIQDAEYFFQKLDESLNKAWELGVLKQEYLDELRNVDVRKHLCDGQKQISH